MAISIGANTVWRFFINGSPAAGAVLRFWRNDNRSITQPAYTDAGGTNPVTELPLDINGEPNGNPQLYFDDTLVYYITVTNSDNSLVYYEIEGYTPIGGGGSPTVNNNYLDRNHVPNPQFFFNDNDTLTFTNDTERKIAPPSWFFKRISTTEPTDNITFNVETVGATTIGAQAESTPTYNLVYTKTVNGTGETAKELYFKIPTSRAFAGETITLTMDVKGSAAYTVDLFYQQNCGSAPGSGAQAKTLISTENVTTNWSTVSGNASVTDLTGLTVNPDDDFVVFGVDINGLNTIAGTFEITNIQLYIGNSNITYIYSDPQYDNALSLPIPAKPASSAELSVDTGKSIVVDNDGNWSLSKETQVEDNFIWGGDFTTNPWQEGTTTSFPNTANTSAYVTDGYKLLTIDARGSGSKFQINGSKLNEAPTFADANYHTSDSLRLSLAGGAQPVLAANDLIRLEHVIEGYDWSQAEELPFTIGFWVRSSITGTFCVALSNSGNDLAYIHEYTIDQVNTWEFKQFEVQAYTGGTWNYTTGVGLRISWTLAAGSAYHVAPATRNTWQAVADRYATSNITNFAVTTESFDIALPQLHQGGALPPFAYVEPLNVLKKARRYYEKSTPSGTATSAINVNTPGFSTGFASPNGGGGIAILFHGVIYNQEKRVLPTAQFYSATGTAGGINDISAGYPGTQVVPNPQTLLRGSKNNLPHLQGNSGGGANVPVPGSDSIVFHWTADARF